MCSRFKYKILTSYEGKNHIITISDWRYGTYVSVPSIIKYTYKQYFMFPHVPQDPEFYLLWLRANYPRTWTGFGHPQAEGSFRSWLVLSRDPHGLRPLWAAGKWTHLCLGYSKATGEFKIIRDGERLDVTKEGPDPDFTGVEIPEDFLSKTYIGRCSHSFNWACSSPESEVTTTTMHMPYLVMKLILSPRSHQFSDFNVWDRFMSDQEMVQWTSCK